MNAFLRIVITAVLFCAVSLVRMTSLVKAASPLSDADEVHAGKLLADKFIALEEMQPTPQSRKIEAYLQTVGDRLAAHSQRSSRTAFISIRIQVSRAHSPYPEVRSSSAVVCSL
jgi:predicted Zn-dependent protease